MLILSESDLRRVLSMREVIEAVESAFRALAAGQADAPERTRFDVPGHSGIMLVMPAFLGSNDDHGSEALGAKIVSVFEGNSRRGIANIQSVYLLFDSRTGVPLSLMDGRFITGIRTAATSAVATKFMAPAGKMRLAVFGAGVQARFHIEAIIEVAEVEAVMIVSRTREKTLDLAENVRSSHGITCEVVSPEEAVKSADLICTCTSSPTPLFEGTLVRAGAHINAVGAFSPSTRELDSVTIRRSRVIIDAESAAGREAGEILMPISEGAIDSGHVRGTLADVVSGKLSGRESAGEITLFKSCGLAIEDLVTARLAFDKATARGVGETVNL